MALNNRRVLTQDERDETIDATVRALGQRGIRFILDSYETSKFRCYRRSDNKEFTYYAATGKVIGIKGYIGIKGLINLLCK